MLPLIQVIVPPCYFCSDFGKSLSGSVKLTFCVFVRGISVGTPTPAVELGYLDFGCICTLPYTWIFDVRIKRTESLGQLRGSKGQGGHGIAKPCSTNELEHHVDHNGKIANGMRQTSTDGFQKVVC